jgi:hypothetical protein
LLVSRIAGVLGGGRLGMVFLYELAHQHFCAVKVVDLVHKENEKALRAELATYALLQELQGLCIPRLLGVLESPSGMRLGVALQLLDTSLGDDFRVWSEEQRRSAKNALMVLFEKFNIRHNDIRGANFGVDRDSGNILVFDLEDVSREPVSKKLADKYVEYVNSTLRLV